MSSLHQCRRYVVGADHGAFDHLSFGSGLWFGKTPYQTSSLFGYHKIIVSKKFDLDVGLYEPSESKELTLDIGDQESLFFEFPLPPELEVTSNPLGVVVLIDGKNVGLTPFKGQVSTGRHEVHVAVKGLKDLPPPKAVTLDLGDQEQISFVLNLRSGEKIVKGVQLSS